MPTVSPPSGHLHHCDRCYLDPSVNGTGSSSSSTALGWPMALASTQSPSKHIAVHSIPIEWKPIFTVGQDLGTYGSEILSFRS
ncbi:hypothetical protein CY34DRAFT_802461 [Suillus luteus UH-Slu-Lm8-n1]|uniref:Uncharacterized protein n=1 Tax=Suillus luteus UH-Slu-Lm8-n1 TaxID=930992 RepID=A0A0D0BMZ3_9AGAM|nr:hypothetical protein CY34DRAFT_802461 [Suillus luteus UH-Slu-Lm8-n1]